MTDAEYITYLQIENNVANDFVTNPTNNPLTTMVRLRQYTSEIKFRHITELIDNILGDW